MLHLKNGAIQRIRLLCCQSNVFSTQVDEFKSAKPFKEIPGPSLFKLLKEASLPSGKYYQMSNDVMMKKFIEEYGPIVKIPGAFGRNDVIMVYLPDDVEKINRTEGKRPIRRGVDSLHYFRTNYRQDIYKEHPGLISSQGEEWYNFRSKVNGAFMQPKITKLYVPKIDEVVKDFVKKIRQIRDTNNEMPNSFHDNLNDFALESIAVIALDARLGVIDNPNNSKLNQIVKDAFVSLYEFDVQPSIWKYYKTAAFKKAMKNYEQLTEIVNNYVSSAIENRKKSQTSEENEGVLDKLLKIDKNVAIVMVQDMLAAGIDTTAITAAIVLYCLARNPEKQERLRQEIFKLLPEKDSELTTSSLNNFPYLRACLKESMRLHPPTSGNGRGLTQDLVLQGYKIPKNTDVFMPTLVATDETFFKRGKEFIPERWLKDNTDPGCPHAKDSHPYAFLPFGHGTRMCLGRRFAELEVEVLITRLLREFKVEWQNPELKFKTLILNTPIDPLKFKFTDL